jgi:hypothetical protein
MQAVSDFYNFRMSTTIKKPPPLPSIIFDTDPLVLKDHFTEDDLDHLGIEHPKRYLDQEFEPAHLFDD